MQSQNVLYSCGSPEKISSIAKMFLIFWTLTCSSGQNECSKTGGGFRKGTCRWLRGVWGNHCLIMTEIFKECLHRKERDRWERAVCLEAIKSRNECPALYLHSEILNGQYPVSDTRPRAGGYKWLHHVPWPHTLPFPREDVMVCQSAECSDFSDIWSSIWNLSSNPYWLINLRTYLTARGRLFSPIKWG